MGLNDTASLDQIAGALERLAIVAEKWYDKLYPVKVPSDATITHIPTDEDKLLESLGGSGDKPLSEWLGELNEEQEAVGPRERAVIKKTTG